MVLNRRISLSATLLLMGIVLLAMNLRGPMTSIAPLLNMIQNHFGITPSTAGLLTSVPLLVLAIMSPFCANLAARFGLERMLFVAIVSILAGVLIRSSTSLPLLYIGTCFIGVGIALGNVLLPSLVKREFPNHIAVVTSVYALSMGVAAALLSATVVPLAINGLDWYGALAVAAIVAFISALLWLPQLKRPKNQLIDAVPAGGFKLWRYPLAWQITFFLSCNSMVYYVMIGWLPAMATDAGFDARDAGNLHGLMQLASSFSGFLLLAVLPYCKDQRIVAVMTTAISMLGLLGIWLLPSAAYYWSFLFGFGNGATFILALSFFGMRTHNNQQAAALSGMAQSISYLLAALAPWLMGSLHEFTGSWTQVLIGCVVINSALALLSVFVGRQIQIPLPTAVRQ